MVCMKTQLYLNLLVRFDLVGSPARSLVMLILLQTHNHLKKFETYLVNFTNDLNFIDIMKHFKEVDTAQFICEGSNVRTSPNHYNCLESYQCRLSKQ